MKKYFACALWLSIFFILYNNVQGQNGNTTGITGTVLDSLTGKPVEGATIVLQKATDALYHKTVLSEKEGSFAFLTVGEGSYHITVTHTGYKIFKKEFLLVEGSAGLQLVIKMQAVSKELKEVVVTSEKNKFVEIQLDKVVVNANALISASGGNAVDILNSSPGVMVDENGGVSLKGREGVIIYVDDRPVQLSGTDLLNYLKSLPSSLVDKVELMSNPSSKYNAEGAAIINIKTKKIKAKGFYGSVSASAGSGRYFKSNGSLLLNYKINRFNFFMNTGVTANNTFFLSNRQRKYSYPNAALSYTLLQDVQEISHDKSGNYRAGVDYDVSKHSSLGVMADGYTSPYREKGIYSNRFIDPSGKSDSSMISNSRYHHKPNRNSVNVYARHLFDGMRKEININLNYLHYTTSADQTLESNVFKPDGSQTEKYTLLTESPFDAKIYSAKVDYSDTIFGKIKIEPGIQTINSIRNNTSSYFTKQENVLYPNEALNNSFRYRETINAAYINVQRSFKRLSAQAGVRVESTAGNAVQYDMPAKPDTSFSIHYTNWFPTAYLMYTFDKKEKHQLNFSIARRIERPGYYDLNPSSFFFDRNTSNSGNSLLQPSFSTNMELSYTYNKKITTELSYSNTKGWITRGYKQVGDAFIGMQTNVDRFTDISLNITWQFNACRWWNVNIYHELEERHFRGRIFNEDLWEDKRLVTFYLKTYNQFKFNKGWSADLTTTYRSKFLQWQSSIRSLAQMHAGLQKKINEKATLTVAGNDIFHTWKVRRDINIQYANVYYYLIFDTQTFAITFRYRFGKSVNNRERKTGLETEAGRVQ